MLEVAAASKETGTPAGYVCATREMAELRLAQGFRFINYGLDHFVLLGGMREIRELARQWTEGAADERPLARARSPALEAVGRAQPHQLRLAPSHGRARPSATSVAASERPPRSITRSLRP